MEEKNATKIICAICGTLGAIVGGCTLVDSIHQRREEKKEKKAQKEKEKEERKRNGGFTDAELHTLEFKAAELDLMNKKKVEGYKSMQEIKHQYDKMDEPRTTRYLKEVKERICSILHLDEYRRPEERPMLEEDEKTNERVFATPLVGNLIKLGDRVIVAGEPGVGKSTIAVQLADDISSENVSKLLPIGSDSTKPQRTFLIDNEQDKNDRKERMGRKHFSIRLRRLENAKFPSVYCLLDDLNERVSMLNEDATFTYDNLKSICGEPSPEQTRHLFEGLSEIQNQAIARGIHITIIFVTHFVKDVSGIPEMSDIAGAANITRFAKNIICLSKIKENNMVLMTNPKLRHSEKNEPIILKMVVDSEDNPMIHFQYVRTISGDKVEAIMKGSIKCNENVPEEDERNKEKYDENIKTRIVELYKNEKKSFRDIAEILKGEGVQISHTTVSNIFKEMTALQGVLKPAFE